jgi:(p)ppGpp synthase/HD superfamily hydrolase
VPPGLRNHFGIGCCPGIKIRMGPLEEAILIAVQAHAGAKDKGGAPYVLHPLRVMFRMKTEAERITAVLHDVVEDSDWTLEGLRERGFSREVVEAIDHLTHRPEESYEDYIERAAKDRMALKVKIADLEDNLDLTRIKKPTEENTARLRKYQRALDFLKPLQRTD